MLKTISDGAAGTSANAGAGASAAKDGSAHIISLVATDGARYTVPSTINVDRMSDLLTVRFRVGDVYKNSFVSVYFDDERVMHNQKRIMSPGEMEQIILRKSQLSERPQLKTITVKIENE